MTSRPRRIALKPDYQVSRIPEQSLASPVNMYAEVQSGKGAFPLHCMPGSKVRKAFGSPIRGQAVIDGVHYVVAGETLYTMVGAVATSCGSVLGGGLVQIVPNRFQVGIVSGQKFYVWDKEHLTLTEVAQTDENGFGGIEWLCVDNGLGIFGTAGGDRFSVTGINDFTTINPTDVATAENRADPLVTGVVANSTLYLMGLDTIEVWDNTGAADFPFDRTMVLEIGAVSRDTVQVIGRDVYFVGIVSIDNARQIGLYRLSGTSAQKVSTNALDRILERAELAGTLPWAASLVWGIDGHVFYRLTTSVGSFDYDVGLNLAVRVGSGVWLDGEEPLPSALTTHARVGGVNVFGDVSGRLLDMTFGENSEGGNTFVREFTTPVTGDLGRETIVDRIELECKTGVGSNTVDPVVYLSVSKDGGHTWGQQRAGQLRKIGAYGREVSWWRLGKARDWVFRFRMTDDAPLKVVGVWADVEQCR